MVEVLAEDGSRTGLYLRRGETVHAEQGTLGETLGRQLLLEGAIDREQYANVIELMTERLIDDEELRFGEAAVQLGYLTHEQVHLGLVLQVKRKLVRCLAFPRLDCTVHDTPDAVDEVTAFPTPTAAAVLEGMRAHYDESRLDPLLFAVADQVPRLRQDGREWIDRLELRGEEHRATQRLRGDVTVAALVRESREPLAVKRALAALVALDVVDLLPVAPPGGWSSTTGDAPAACAVATTPGVDARAPPPLAESTATPRDRASHDVVPSPPRADAPGPSEGERARRAEEAAMRIARAVGRSLPPQLGDKRARLHAEHAFERGLRHARAGAWARAHEELERAHRLAPAEIEYELHAAHAALVAGVAHPDRSSALEALDALAARALAVNRQLAFAHYARGVVSLERGRDEAALRCFRDAARLDPTHLDAARHARLLAKRLERG